VQHMRYFFSERKHALRDLATHRAFRRPGEIVRRQRQRVDELNALLAKHLSRRIEGVRRRVHVSSTRMASFDLGGRIRILRVRIERRHGELGAALERAVVRQRRRYAAAQLKLASANLRARVSLLRRGLERRTSEFAAHARRYFNASRRRLEAATVRLEERSPFHLLERGYAIAYDTSGRVLRSAEQVVEGDAIRVRLARGEVNAQVQTTKKYE
jgi:exodeoxyribonuclease VII large subunit